MPGPILMTSSLLSLSLWTDPPSKWVSRIVAHPYLVVHCPAQQYSLQCWFATADYMWRLHLNHIQFHFILSEQRRWLWSTPQVSAHKSLTQAEAFTHRDRKTHTRESLLLFNYLWKTFCPHAKQYFQRSKLKPTHQPTKPRWWHWWKKCF